MKTIKFVFLLLPFIVLFLATTHAQAPDIECSPNPLYISAKGCCSSLEFTYRNYPEKIDKELREKMENASSDELLPVIVEFDKLIDTGFLYNQVKGMGKRERRAFTINTLKEFTASYQEDVMEHLERIENSGRVEKLNQLWLTNSIGMKAAKEVIEEVAKHSNVALIWLDDKLSKFSMASGAGIGYNYTTDSRDIVWNVQKINADSVWTLGYTGQNIIIGHISDGVNYTHWDLRDHLWDGSPIYPHHGWDFVDNDDDPYREGGAGTITAGVFAGDGTAGTTTGVAPDPQIMILRAIPGYLFVLEAAINFALTNGAHVITMSAGWDSAGATGSWNYLSTQTRTMANNCLNAGVVFSTSAGNGNGMGGHYEVPYDIQIPGNVPPPWYGNEGHSAVMAVGATNQDNSIASFSSYGPTQWWFSPWYEYPYPPGLIKPDVSAPGGSPGITSCSPDNDSEYVYGFFGTSLSCPHLTGLISLMLSKNPNLTPEEIDNIVEITCLDLGSPGKDNYYGSGLINAFDAVNTVGSENITGGVFYCKNVGDSTLLVINIWKSTTWIFSVTPTSFSVLPNDSQEVTVNVNPSGLTIGTYYDTLWIYSNDPDEYPYGEVILLNVTGVEEESIAKSVPLNYNVRCYPNPARNVVSILFTLPRKEEISLDVFDVTGRKITHLASGDYESGTHQIVWNRISGKEVRVPQGVYFVRLKAVGIETQGKLILLQ